MAKDSIEYKTTKGKAILKSEVHSLHFTDTY